MQPRGRRLSPYNGVYVRGRSLNVCLVVATTRCTLARTRACAHLCEGLVLRRPPARGILGPTRRVSWRVAAASAAGGRLGAPREAALGNPTCIPFQIASCFLGRPLGRRWPNLSSFACWGCLAIQTRCDDGATFWSERDKWGQHYGSLQIICFTRICLVPPLICQDCLCESAKAYLFPQSDKIHYFAAAPLLLTSFPAQPTFARNQFQDVFNLKLLKV